MDLLIVSALTLLVFFPAVFLLSVLLKRVLWALNPLFFSLNRIIWWLYNPLRSRMKKTDKPTPSILFKVLFFTLIVPTYWIVIHILLTPLRLVNALYFDVLLYFSVMLGDLVSELFDPKPGDMRHQKKKSVKYVLAYLVGFPKRFIFFFVRNFLTVLDSLFMFSMGVVLPTLTMYHGTEFTRSIANIGQAGQWLVGGGEFAGRGIYFGIEKRTADHYARNYNPRGIIVARVTLSFTRNLASLNKEGRDQIGSDGGRMSQKISPLWSATEHWRDGSLNWWEYCLIHKGNIGDFVKTWRIRPVAFIGSNGGLERLWKGQTHYSINTFKSFVIGAICTALLIPFLMLFSSIAALF